MMKLSVGEAVGSLGFSRCSGVSKDVGTHGFKRGAALRCVNKTASIFALEETGQDVLFVKAIKVRMLFDVQCRKCTRSESLNIY
jgi:hypothetical protein